MKLYRPVGLKELSLILNTGCRRYPERLQGQPFFYPVLNEHYAIEIADKWNTVDEKSDFVGFVTTFNINDKYISKHDSHKVGASQHQELWIAAKELNEFNANIMPPIQISHAFYGKDYKGARTLDPHPNKMNYIEKFIQLNQYKHYNSFDFSCEVQSKWKMITANYLFWKEYNFMPSMGDNEKKELLSSIKNILQRNQKWFFAF